MAAEKRVALAIGNATYAHASVLKTPSNDARLIATMFRTIGFTEVREQHDLDKAAFDGALDRFAAQARSADWALIYYAGHAVEIGGAFYLLPTDANVKGGTDLDKEGISLGRVLGPESRPHRLTNRGPRYRMQQLDQARRDTDFAVQVAAKGVGTPRCVGDRAGPWTCSKSRGQRRVCLLTGTPNCNARS